MSDILTVQDLIDEVRADLDEAADVDGNDTTFYVDSEFVTWLNKGIRKVWQIAREAKENWFLRKMSSTDGKKTIYGRAYDPASLTLTSGIREIKLPPDCFELRLIEPITSSTQEERDDDVEFILTDLANPAYRRLSRTEGPEIGGRYECDLIFRESGPVLSFAPAVTLLTDMPIRIEYVAAPRRLRQRDTFEGTGLNEFMLDAVAAYVTYRARKKEGNAQDINVALQDYSDEAGAVRDSAGPRQSRDPEFVPGFMEDEIY